MKSKISKSSENQKHQNVLSFSKQVAKIPARLDLFELPEGYGFQIELKLDDSTENDAQPMIEGIELGFD